MRKFILPLILGWSGIVYCEPSTLLINQLQYIAKSSSLFDDNISQQELQFALRQKIQSVETCDKKLNTRKSDDFTWILIKSEPSYVIFFMCEARESVHVKEYKTKDNNNIYLIATEKGNHSQTWEFEFLKYNKGNKSFTKVKNEALGIIPPKENEFLSPKSAFSPNDNNEAPLFLSANGAIYSEPWTWMNPKWDKKKTVYRIHFEWNGEIFMKIRESAI